MKRRTLFIILGAVVVLVIALSVGLFFLLPSFTSASSATTSNTQATPVVTPTPIVSKIATDLRTYGPDVKNQIAQGLKLTPDQLTADLQSGQTLTQIAAAQGVSSTQLQTLVTNAIETGMQPAVTNGDIKQKQLDNLAKRYGSKPDLLDRLLGGKALKKKTGTPTPTATAAQ